MRTAVACLLVFFLSAVAVAQDGQWSATALSTLNTPLGGYTVTVYDYGTTDLATLYSDEQGTAQDNPLLTAGDGTYSFWAASGDYRIIITATGKPEWGPYQTVDITVSTGSAVEKSSGGGNAGTVVYTPAEGTDWVDPDPALVSTGLDDLAARITAEEADAGVTDHGALTGLADDDHTGYALLTGRAGGQTIIGGTGATDDLTLDGSAGTAGYVVITEAGRLMLQDVGFSRGGDSNNINVTGPTGTVNVTLNAQKLRTSGNFYADGQFDYVTLSADTYLGWNDSTTLGGGGDNLKLYRDDVGVLAQRVGTAAQKYRLYNTYTNSTNYERLALQSGAGYFEIAAETAGTGTDDIDVRLTPAGTGALQVPATVETLPGVDLGISATAPAATTGASQAGKAVAITASDAVASTDTEGAAAGGAVTISSGDAARFTSGNANGGAITILPGAGIGTGTVGAVTIGAAGAGTGTSAFTVNSANRGLLVDDTGWRSLWQGGLRGGFACGDVNGCTSITSTGAAGTFGGKTIQGWGVAIGDDKGVRIRDTHALSWSASSTETGTQDTGMYRDAAGTIGVRYGAGSNSLNTYTVGSDTTNYERLALQGATGYVEVAAETGGTGADNVDIRLTPAGTGAVVPGRMMLPMGEINYFSLTGTAIAVAAQSTTGTNNTVPVAVASALTSGQHEFDNGGSDNGRLRYTGAVTRMFHTAASVSFSGGANDTFSILLAKNGNPITTGTVALRKMGAGGDVGSTAIHVMVEMATNDYLELYVGNTTDVDDPTFHSVNLFALGM